MTKCTTWDCIEDLKIYIDSIRDDRLIVLTSMGADPLHVGHSRCILYSSNLGELIVVVNSDGFLIRKKGFVFMPLEERMEIISSLKGVKHVIAWDDGTQYVDGALRRIRPDFFTKGGDRSTLASIAETEVQACKDIGCTLLLGVGGKDKIQSSSALIEGAKQYVSIYKKGSI